MKRQWKFIVVLIAGVISLFLEFGMHASKSWICLVASTSIFILLTYLSLNVTIPINIKLISGK